MGGREALQFLRKANIQAGQKLLVNGAGGSFGTFAVQSPSSSARRSPRWMPRRNWTCSAYRCADQVVDYTQQDFTASGDTYDVIFDVIGKSPFVRSVKSLRPNGWYLLANPKLAQLVRGRWTSSTSNKKVIFGVASGTNKDLAFLRDLIEAGKLRSVIDRSYPLEQMAEAHRYAETGRKMGNLVITVAQDSTS